MKFFSSCNGWAGLIARLTLGFVMLPHGLQKLFGWFDGPGFEGFTGFMGSMGVPFVIAVLVVLGESLGALALILGFAGRFMAGGIAVIMLGAIILVHNSGFFAPKGFEYQLLTIGLALITIVGGSGKWSIDSLIMQRFGKKDGCCGTGGCKC